MFVYAHKNSFGASDNYLDGNHVKMIKIVLNSNVGWKGGGGVHTHNLRRL